MGAHITDNRVNPMILLLAILAGLVFGLARSWIAGRGYQPATLAYIWLVALAILPQVVAFYYAPTARSLPGWAAALCLVGSQVGLLVFVGLNLNRPGFWVLGLGLGLNLLVIAANHGLMPISPEVAAQLVPGRSPETWHAGLRFGWSKDIVLPRSETRMWWLSDRFLLPGWFPLRVAFSFGDVLIALGIFWLLWTGGGPLAKPTKVKKGDS